MPQVQVFGGLRDAVDGAESIRVEGTTVRELLKNLSRDYPPMRQRIEQGIAIAIDCVIYRDD